MPDFHVRTVRDYPQPDILGQVLGFFRSIPGTKDRTEPRSVPAVKIADSCRVLSEEHRAAHDANHGHSVSNMLLAV